MDWWWWFVNLFEESCTLNRRNMKSEFQMERWLDVGRSWCVAATRTRPWFEPFTGETAPTTGNSKNLGLCRIRICIHLFIHWEVTSFCLFKLCWSCNLSLFLSMLGEPGKGSHVGCMAPEAKTFGSWLGVCICGCLGCGCGYFVVSCCFLLAAVWVYLTLTKNILLDY